MKTHRLLAVACLGLVFGPAPAARANQPPPERGDAQDLLYFHDARPIFLRLRIEVDGKPFRAYWSDSVAKLHKFLDADGDGVLSAKERGGWLARMVGGAPTNPNAKTVEAPNRLDAVATPADLANYLRVAFGPFQLQIAPRGEAGPETLFGQLDLDGDKALSESELRAADATLRKFDRDDDETIRAQELLPYENPFAARRLAAQGMNRGGPTPDDAPFVALGEGESRTRVVRRLLALYDKHGGPDDDPGKDGKLQVDEIGLAPAAFETADNDGDGGLDSDELVRALPHIPPSLELRVKAGHAPGAPATIEAVDAGPGAGQSTSLAAMVRKGSPSELGLALDTVLLEFNARPGGAGIDVREFYRQQFRAADSDNNKYLELKEVQNNGVFRADNFRLMDRDGDGKLFEEEMDAFVGQQSDAAESRTMLAVTDQGRSLFEVLDLNRDRRLSVRELRGAVKKVASWDRNGDGAVSADEVPRHLQLNFGRGQSPLLTGLNFFSVVSVEGGGPGGPAAVAGPDWFRKMDRNADGDLSAREFLGTAEQFRRLDADADGLIDPSEAAAASAKAR